MGLKLTLKPNEKIIINGCVVRNAPRKQTLTIETHADVIRDIDILDEAEAATPVKEVYFFVQAAMLQPHIRDEITPIIQKRLGKLVPVFNSQIGGHLMEAANHVSARNYYNALKAIKPVINYERELLALVPKPEPSMVQADEGS
jgi:flagellar protein FlbT